MSSLRRGILARFSGTPSNARNRTLPPTVDRFDVRLQEDDNASIRTVLPAYSRNSVQSGRPPSPAPTYVTVDESAGSANSNEGVSQSETGKVNPSRVIDQFIVRLQEVLKSPKTWRVHNNGERSFFWALRCAPGAADILNDNIEEIKSATVDSNWRVEKFCVIFQGQTLGNLLCRPIHTEVVRLFVSLMVDIWIPH